MPFPFTAEAQRTRRISRHEFHEFHELNSEKGGEQRETKTPILPTP